MCRSKAERAPYTLRREKFGPVAERRGKLLYPEPTNPPRDRSQCREGPRPCPYVSCRYHLYLDMNPKNGSVKFNFPGKEPWELEESCALDVADRGEHGNVEIGRLMNMTREGIRFRVLRTQEKIRDALRELQEETEER